MAWTLVLGLASLLRDGQTALALAAIILPTGIFIILRLRRSNREMMPVTSPQSGRGAAIVSQLSRSEQLYIAGLATAGDAIGAIKALRKRVNTDLRTAKEIVASLAASDNDR